VRQQRPDDPPRAPQDEVARLIDLLHQTSQRLEELTAGEVDSVTDRHGRTIVLRHAQEHIRQSNAERQSTLLDALPARVAMLDAQGVILAANETWRRFAADHALPGQGVDIGANHLRFADTLDGGAAAEAGARAQGIRAVLDGRSGAYSVEYQFDMAGAQHSFLMSATPVGSGPGRGAVLMYLDLSAEHQAKQRLRESEEQFRQMAENIGDVFFLCSPDGRSVFYVSPAYEAIWGRSCASLHARPGSWADAIYPEDRKALAMPMTAPAPSEGLAVEYRIVRADGSLRWIQARAFPVHDDQGKVVRVAGIAKDVTEQREAARRIVQLNRVYAILSAINTLIVRVTDRETLFQGACRIAVDAGGLSMAMIGIVDAGSGRVVPVASAGADHQTMTGSQSRLSTADEAHYAASMEATAIRGGHAVIDNHAARTGTSEAAHDGAARGAESIAVLPLLVADKGVGVLALHAGEPDFFGDEEMALLNELASDIAFAIDHIEKQERLDYLAYYDVLTGLANRALFVDRLTQHLRSVSRGGRRLAVALLDLERFKNINDSLGQAAGDALLRLVAAWLIEQLGDASLLARFGVDHFAVVLPDAGGAHQVGKRLEALIKHFGEHPFQLGEATFRVTFKVGAAIHPADGKDAATLLQHAEAALKRAKASGVRYLLYQDSMSATAAGRPSLESRLRGACSRGEFVLHFQPKLNLASGKLAGAEALIRWQDPLTGLVPPGNLISVLEETGLIHEVGRWALQQAVRDYLDWRRLGLDPVRIAVNVSALQLRDREFIDELSQILAHVPEAAAGLELEITESVIMADIPLSTTSLASIRALGVSIAIDDFGTGFSSLSYLSRLPIDAIKIDRSFITEMTKGPTGLALVSTIIQLAQALELRVVAEGVESEAQAQLLRLLRCDDMQGFLVSAALPADAFATGFLRNPPDVARDPRAIRGPFSAPPPPSPRNT